MIGLVCLILMGDTLVTEPIEYLMIPHTIVYDENIVADGNWLGVFETDSGSELRYVDLQLPWQDFVPDEGERPPGRRVSLPGETEFPLFLVWSASRVFTEGPVTTFIYSTSTSLSQESSIFLNTPGLARARLYASREGLFLSSSGITQHITDTFPGADSNSFLGIVWAGDLDRDGKLDLVIDDVDDWYDIYNWNLYLSTESSPEQLLGWVASFRDVYY